MFARDFTPRPHRLMRLSVAAILHASLLSLGVATLVETASAQDNTEAEPKTGKEDTRSDEKEAAPPKGTDPKALAVKPTMTAKMRAQLTALKKKGRAQTLASQPEEAARSYTLYLKLSDRILMAPIDRERAEVHYALAKNLAGRGELEKALEHVEQAVRFGYWQAKLLEATPGFQQIKARPRFRKALARARSGPARIAFGWTAVDGRKMLEKDYVGKPLVVTVWGTWCMPCLEELPALRELAESYRDKGLAMLGLNYENASPSEALRKRTLKFLEENDISWPCALIEKAVAKTLPRFRGFPTTIFIDRNGAVHDIHTGTLSRKELFQKTDQMLRVRAKQAAAGK